MRVTSRAPMHVHPAIAAAVLLAALGLEGRAAAETADAVEGRLTLLVSYGFLARFYQADAASGANPYWGHGVFMRVGGERCSSICYGLNVSGQAAVDPSGTGFVGVGPHIGLRWDGPSWAGPYYFRTGVSYMWLYAPEPTFSNGTISLGDGRSAHGVNVWLSLGLELLGNRVVTPIIALVGEYTAVVSTDPIEHLLSAQGVVGLTFGRRMVFNRGGETGAEVEQAPQAAEPDDIQLEDEDEERLREAEDELRGQ
jgi:hypothetical protein